MEIENNYLIVKNNKLVESRYKLSLQEQKLILILTSKIQKNDDDLKRYEFTAKKLADFLGVSKDKYYSSLKQITKKLLGRVFQIVENDKLTQYNWISVTEYDKGVVRIGLNPNLKPYLLQLKGSFTKYQLKNIVQMNSVYAIRIYELCKQYENTKQKERIIELEELKAILGIENKYKKYNDFKKYVLEIAKREINLKTDIEIDFKGEKTGQKITDIKFIIKKNEEENSENFKEVEYIEEIKKTNYSEEVLNLYNVLPIEEQLETRKNELEKILKSHSYEMILGDINYCKNNAKDNFWGYFLKSLKSGHYGKVNIKKEKIKEEEKQKKIENKKLENQKIENEKNKLLEAKERNNILDEKYNLVDETAKKLIRDTADDIVENEGKKFPIKTIRESMFSTLYKYKAMEELMKYNLI